MELFQDGLGIFLLTTSNRQLFLLLISSDLHPQHKRYVAHVSHIDLLHQLGIASNHKKIVHIEREDDDDPVVVVDVDAYIRLRGTNPIEIRAGSIV